MPQFIARLLGLGAYAASAGIVGLYLLVVYASRQTATGGIDASEAHIVWLALGGLTVAIVIAHHVLGRQLLAVARNGDVPHPLGAR